MKTIVKILNIFEKTVPSFRPTRTAESVRGDDDDVGGGVYVAAAMHIGRSASLLWNSQFDTQVPKWVTYE